MKDSKTKRHTTACQSAWSKSAGDVLNELGVDPAVGLDDDEVRLRRQQYGTNQLRAAKRRNVLAIAVDQFRSIVIVLLLAAGILAILFSDHAEGLAIFAVIAINGLIGFFTEWRAIRSMEALSRLGRVETVVMRDGAMHQIPAEQLVPGDIVMREGGDIVTADLRLIEAAKLEADESMLTGESMPVSKTTDSIDVNAPVMERSNTLFKGTAVTRGSAKGVVIGTGLGTELGRISQLVTEAEAQETPLEKRLDTLAQRLVWAVLVLAVIVAIAGVVTGRETWLAIEVAIALAVAAIPEGLPIVATIALARGMWRMARHNALIARLSAVETLGATSVILTDKTGTLTENRMTVTVVQLGDGRVSVPGSETPDSAGATVNGQPLDADSSAILDELLKVAVLCSNASLTKRADGSREVVGDPTEVALLAAAMQRGISQDEIRSAFPEIQEIAFDSDTRRMATLHNSEAGTFVAVKGALETVLPACTASQRATGTDTLADELHDAWLRHAGEFGEQGLRTLAVASKTMTNPDEEPFAGLTLLGIVGIEDPPRAGVKEAIHRCREAGILVVMLTGDHLATARKIAAAVGIVDTADSASEDCFINGPELAADAGTEQERLSRARVFARVSPEQKLNLIDYYQRTDHVVAMTGDGVNDAPALKKADIGIAMGIRGSAVAKEAGAMVLQDDEFGTIVEAVAQGRAIYANIRKFVVYLLSCNISEVLVVSIATLAGAPLPLLPLQILFLNLVTDVFPALALGVGEGSRGLMEDKPRPFDEPVLTRAHWIRIGLHGVIISTTVLAAMAIAVFQLGFDSDRAVTVSFTTLALAQLWHVFNMRDDMRQWLKNEITRNIWIWAAIGVCVLLLLVAIYVEPFSSLLSLSHPGTDGWLLIVGMSLLPVLIAPLVRALAPQRTA